MAFTALPFDIYRYQTCFGDWYLYKSICSMLGRLMTLTVISFNICRYQACLGDWWLSLHGRSVRDSCYWTVGRNTGRLSWNCFRTNWRPVSFTITTTRRQGVKIIVNWFRYLRDYLTLFSLDSFATNVKSNRACYASSCYRAFYDVIGLYSILFIIIISHRVWWISSYLSVFKLIHTVIVSLLCLDPVSIGRVGGYSQPGGYSGSVGVFWWEHRGFRQRGYDDGLQSHSVHRQHWQGQRLVSRVSLF